MKHPEQLSEPIQLSNRELILCSEAMKKEANQYPMDSFQHNEHMDISRRLLEYALSSKL